MIYTNMNGDTIYLDKETSKQYLLMEGHDLTKEHASYDICLVFEYHPEKDFPMGDFVNWFAGASLGDEYLAGAVAHYIS